MRVMLAACAILVACGSRTDLSGEPNAGADASDSSSIEADVDASRPGAAIECDAQDRRVLADVFEGPGQIVAGDDGYVYWAESNGIRRVRKTGGTPEMLGIPSVTSNDLLDIFAVDSSFVYFATDSLVRVPKDGGAEQPLGLVQSGALVVIDGMTLFTWTPGQSTLQRLPTGGGVPTVVTSSLPSDTNALVVDGSRAYGASAQAGTFAVDLGSGSIENLDPTEAVNLIADDTYLYFTTGKHGPTGSNAVMRVPKGGGAATQIVNAAYAFAITLDGSTLYYSDRLTGQILHVDKNGGPATVFETELAEETKDIAVDDKCVYWTSNHIGGVFVAPK